MKKKYALSKLYSFGDALISLKNGKTVLGTTDFSTKYIRKTGKVANLLALCTKVPTSKKKYDIIALLRKTHNKILIFNWTDNKFDLIDCKDISFMTPLSKVLNNEPREI